MRAPRRPGTSRQAFTLVEIIASIVVIATVAGVTSSILVESVDAYAETSAASELVRNTAMAMDRVTDELRAIPGADGIDPPAPDIDEVDESSIRWSGDCSIRIKADRLLLGIDGGEHLLLDGVGSLQFACFDEDGAALSLPLAGDDCLAVRRIVVTLEVSRMGVSTTLRSGAFLRAGGWE